MQEPDRERTPPGALGARRHQTPAGEPGPVPARYLVDQATITRVTTLTRRLPAIVKPHLLAGHDDPTGAPAVCGVLRGLRRERGTTQRGAAWPSDGERILAATQDHPEPHLGTALRDRGGSRSGAAAWPSPRHCAAAS